MSDESDLMPTPVRPFPDRPSDFRHIWAHDVATVIHEAEQLKTFLTTELPRLTAELNAATERFNQALRGLDARNDRLEQLQTNLGQAVLPEVQRQLTEAIGNATVAAKKEIFALHRGFTDTLKVKVEEVATLLADDADRRAIQRLTDTAAGTPGAALAAAIKEAVAAGVAEEFRKEKERQEKHRRALESGQKAQAELNKKAGWFGLRRK